MTEGGVHTHLRSRLPTSGVSVRHMRACLLDFILRHNLLVGTFNSTGQKYTGHDSIWLMNEIQELEITLSERYPNTSPGNPSWINGNLYQPTTEQMGIMRIPDAVRSQAFMQPFNPNLHNKQKQSFLARLQGTKKAVLPLHTAGERQLFSELMKTCEDFTSTTGTVSSKAVQIWNSRAEDKPDVFYKLSEQLTAYYNGDWKSNSDTRLSLSLAFKQTQPVQKRIHDPKRSQGIMITKSGPLQPHTVIQGLQNVEEHIDVDESSNRPTTSGLGSTSIQSLRPPTYQSTVTALSKKHVAAAQPEEPLAKKARIRTCPRCGRGKGCNGLQGWYRCTHACQDCGSRSVRECAGRDSKRKQTPHCGPQTLPPAAQKFIVT
ncbi:hypothetical protein BDZ89DRAFT_1149037 [Hymenopellis radicata]|nr:hypothetical protein BDZ89DRAFT_1149037 [Hymenopellis radicata]